MYKVPPRYEIALNSRAMDILAFGVLCHAAANIWLFTNPEIFPNKIYSVTDIWLKTSYYFTTDSFMDRVFSSNGLPYLFVLGGGIVCFFIIAPIL